MLGGRIVSPNPAEHEPPEHGLRPLDVGASASQIWGAANDNVGPAGAIAPGARSKRLLDVLVSACGLIFLAPLFLLVALSILWSSPGPVFFRQRRTGRQGRVFRILKFRTMSVCEDGPTVRQAELQDPRITRVGAFLRKTSIDELPQLINVLRGEMSLVGPRPHAVAHDEAFALWLPNYRDRFLVTPGITGLAQVRGLRGEIRSSKCLSDRLRADLEYVESWSIASDLKILRESVLLIFKFHGS